MTTELESTMEFKKFLKRIQMVVKNDTVFALGKVRLYNKDRIDDLICCLESSFPDVYKNLIKNKVAKKFQTYQMYLQLAVVLKKKFILSSSIYQVDLDAANALINGLLAKIDEDVRFITNNDGGMY